MKINKISIIFIILTIFVIFITPIKSMASIAKTNNLTSEKNFTEYTIKLSSIEDLIDYTPGPASGGDTQIVTDKLAPIVGTIITIGIVTSVLALIIIGIKYMIGSVEEKAEYKKTMIPYLIGIFMIIGISTIIGVFSKIMSGIF